MAALSFEGDFKSLLFNLLGVLREELAVFTARRFTGVLQPMRIETIAKSGNHVNAGVSLPKYGTFSIPGFFTSHRDFLRGVNARNRFAGLSVLVITACILAGCSESIFQAQGPIGAANSQILLNALGIMLVIVVPTTIGVLVFAWWFRASNTRARYQPGFVYSGRIELIVWAIPLLVILFLGGVIWIGAHALDPFKPIETQEKPVEVQVVSLDWKWLFVYPELGVASVNDLVVPVKAPVHFSLTSASVMNMFFVPQLGSMVATMNGMVTQLWLQADQTGELYGQSSQFSGDGFSA